MTIDADQTISPMMAQWHACKKSAPEGILLFRLGDFYEAFYDDAILLSKELDLTLTKRQEIPMAGVPFHASEGYIDKLVAKGYRVAIAEQMEDPRAVKGLVKREIVRVVTPGTVVNSTLLSDKSNNFLACIAQVGEIHGLSVLDLTTADFRAMEFDSAKELADELCRLAPKEILLPEKWQKKHAGLLEELSLQLSAVIHAKEDWHFDHSHACDVLLRHFRVHNLDGFGLKGMVPAINAAGAMLQYVREDLNLTVDHIKSIAKEHVSSYMLIDRSTQKNLELFDSLHEGKKSPTLLKVLDCTETPMGGRLLKTWLTHPLLDVEVIRERQDAIACFMNDAEGCRQIRRHLSEIRDLERLMMRIETGYASPRDLTGLRFSLEHIAPLSMLLAPFTAQAIARAKDKMPDVSEIAAKLKKALVDSPPLRLSDGGIFRADFHPELSQLRSLQEDSHSWVARYQAELKSQTQIKTLKVGYTKAFGYYIEVSRGQADRIPDHFQRRQTLVNTERFITPELKEFEYKVLHAEERASALELELFHSLRREVAGHALEVRNIAQAVAAIDCLLSLADVASKFNYVRPLVDQSAIFQVMQGRHPVIEASLSNESYIPNDVFLNDTDQRLYLITGPNMAGKSTFIRQVALIAILAQMGSFVPAKEARIGIIDKVFSRIGASDDLSRGQSTFMVEMTETANILHNATTRSLVILDEIGRGTSTYDGISIAWAVAEYLLTQAGKQAKTLFATHYWELTELEKKIHGAVNYNVAVHESDRGIVFLRKIVKGGTDKSYGIHVAKLAGLPYSVLKRAEAMLAQLENSAGRTVVINPSPKQEAICAARQRKIEEGEALVLNEEHHCQKARATRKIDLAKPQQADCHLFGVRVNKDKQLSLFTEGEAVVKELKNIDTDRLTPMEALKKLTEWKNAL